MNYNNQIFNAYLNCICEKQENGEFSIYITCKIQDSVFNQWKALVTNLDESEKVETEPHCSFLWAKMEHDVNHEAVYDIVKNVVEGITFELMPMGFKVFEDVCDGTQDCLVVKLDAPGDISQLQLELTNTLIKSGIKLIQDHPKWNPHMTIAYFPEGTEIKYMNPQNGMLDTSINAKVDYMKINDGKEMELNG